MGRHFTGGEGSHFKSFGARCHETVHCWDGFTTSVASRGTVGFDDDDDDNDDDDNDDDDQFDL